MGDIMIIIQRGGIVIYPLLVLSIISWAIILERAFSLRVSRLLPKGYAQIKALILGRNIDAAVKMLEPQPTNASKAFLSLLKAYLKGRRDSYQLNRIAEDAFAYVISDADKNLVILSTVASVSPLLGLFGTITGLIKVFAAFSTSETQSAMYLLANGISEALTAAATGLAVAIPALFFYWIFKAIENRIVSKVESEVKEIIDAISES